MERKERLEVVAKTVEEAIELALKELGAERDEAEVEVISRGRSGILGIGAEPARVRVTRRPPRPEGEGAVREAAAAVDVELAAVAQEVTSQLLKLMAVDARAYIREAGEDQPVPRIEVEGEDSGLLIGRRGETLRSLQFVVNIVLSRRFKERVGVQVDVEGYKERRYRALRGLALRIAEQVMSTGRSVSLEPMPPAERRAIHMALADHSAVTTESTGEGDGRKVSILPRRK